MTVQMFCWIKLKSMIKYCLEQAGIFWVGWTVRVIENENYQKWIVSLLEVQWNSYLWEDHQADHWTFQMKNQNDAIGPKSRTHSARWHCICILGVTAFLPYMVWNRQQKCTSKQLASYIIFRDTSLTEQSWCKDKTSPALKVLFIE